MKLKNHKIYNGDVNLYIPFQFSLYVISWVKSFNEGGANNEYVLPFYFEA